MSESSRLSSSLHTDSDCSEEIKTETSPVNRRPVTIRNQEPLTTDQYVQQMLAQVREEAYLGINNSSFEISSNNENSFYNPDDDHLMEAEKIISINHKLAKNFTKALMNYKSATRPILSRSQPKIRLDSLAINDFSTIEPNDRSFQAASRVKKSSLSYSLNKIKVLQKIRNTTNNCLQSQLSEIETIDSEREKLKGKLDVLSQSFDSIIKEKKMLDDSSCQCVVF